MKEQKIADLENRQELEQFYEETFQSIVFSQITFEEAIILALSYMYLLLQFKSDIQDVRNLALNK